MMNSIRRRVERANINAMYDRLERADREITELRRQLTEANAIIDKLPKTEDGIPITIGDVVWSCGKTIGVYRIMVDRIQKEPSGFFVGPRIGFGAFAPSNCYSTLEAAEAAKDGE